MASEEPLLNRDAQHETLKKEGGGYLNDISPIILDFVGNIDFQKSPLPHKSMGWAKYRAASKRLMAAVRREYAQPQRNKWGTLKMNIRDVQNKGKLMSAIQAIENLNKVCWRETGLKNAMQAFEESELVAGTCSDISESDQFAVAITRRMVQTMLFMFVCAIPPDEQMWELHSKQLRRKPPPYSCDLDWPVCEQLSRDNTDADFETHLHFDWFSEEDAVFRLLIVQCSMIAGARPQWFNDGWWAAHSALILREWQHLTQSHLVILRERLDYATTMQNKMIALSSTAFLAVFQVAMRYFYPPTSPCG